MNMESNGENIRNVTQTILARVLVTIDGGLDRMIGFIDTLFTQLGTTGNYSAIAIPTI
jgi:hypothetical protein